MTQKLNEQAKAYAERALDARLKADEVTTPALRADYLEMERGWLLLACSCKEVECLGGRNAANSDWQPSGGRADDKQRLQKAIHERDVDVLFERMWLASIVESSDDAIVSKTLDGVITSWNKSAQRLFGYAAEEVIGKPVTIIIPPERHQEEDMILGHIRRGERVEHYETVRRRKDGSLVDISLTVSPIRGAEGKVVGASKIARDITAQKRAEKLLRRQADLLNQSHDAILCWKIGGGIAYWSRGAEALYGYTSEEATGRISHELLQTRAQIPIQDVEAQITQQGSWYGEFTHITRDGRELIVESRLVRVNYDGDLYTLETNRDVTARKHAEEQVDLLMREANHRVKNLLGLVEIIARQTAASCPQGAGHPEDFIGRFTERVKALATNQDLLGRNQWKKANLEDLVHDQLAHFADLVGSRITAQGPKLHLNAAAAQAVGLALHELATNAGKYGALSTDDGRVDVGWQLDGDTFSMSWIERGGPPVRTPERRGFGSTVITSMTKRAVNGEVQADYASSGLEWRLTCPRRNVLEP